MTSGENSRLDPVDELQALQIRWLQEQVERQRWWARLALWAPVILVVMWLLLHIRGTMLVFALAWLIAYLLNPVVAFLDGKRWFKGRTISRNQAILIVYLILMAVLTGVSALLVPQIVNQLQRVQTVKHVFEDPVELTYQVQGWVNKVLSKVPEEYREELIVRLDTLVESSTARIGKWAAYGLKALANFIGQVISGMFFLITGLIISIYILQTWHELGKSTVQILPPSLRSDLLALSQQMHAIFGGYLRATIATSIACFMATFLALWLLTLFTGHSFPYIYLVSLVAGLTYPIPILGILASTILGGILGFIAYPSLGFSVAVAVVVNLVNNIIDRTVQPKLMSDYIGVSPLFVMFGAFAGGELLGVWGMLLGIPLAAMAKALFVWFHGRFLVEQAD